MNAPVTRPVPGKEGHASPQNHGAQHKQHRTPVANLVKGLLVPLLALTTTLAFVGYATTNWQRWVGLAVVQTTDDAQIRAETSRIATRIAGTVVNMPVTDFKAVKAGDLLAEIDPATYKVDVEKAEAAVEAARATTANVDNQIALQRATIQQAEATRASAIAKELETRQERERQDALLPTGSGTKQKAEQALAAHVAAQASLKATEAAVVAQDRQLDVLFGNRRELQAQVSAAKAVLDSATLQLGFTRILAPINGVVGERMVQVGNYVSAGTSLISIVPLPNVYVIANYKETQLANVTVGQPVNITVDGLPGASFEGHVERISPASGSQFALLPPDNATGNFTKVVQRIPVRIALAHDQPNIDRLLPGMSVVASIRTAERVATAAPQ